MKSFLLNTLTVLITTLIMLGAVELGLRWHYYGSFATPNAKSVNPMMPHPTRGFAYTPNAKGWYEKLDYSVGMNFNSLGLRGPEIGPKGRKFRILMVGDSAILASGIPEKQSVPALLEKELGPDRFEVINAGFAAYNTVQQHLFLTEQGLGLQPDLIILAVAPVNDVQMNYRPFYTKLKKSVKRPMASLGRDGKLIIDTKPAKAFYEKNQNRREAGFWKSLTKKLALAQLIRTAARPILYRKQSDPNILIGDPYLAEFNDTYSTWDLKNADYARHWQEAWDIAFALIRDMKQLGEEKGAKFSILLMPSKLQIDKERQALIANAYPELKMDLNKGNRKIGQFAKSIDAPYFDPTEAVIAARDAGEKDLFFSISDDHMTAKSQRIVARYLAGALKNSGLLPVK